jgi:hypothetical protein
VRKYLQSSVSYFDLSKNTPEQVFHVFLLGLLIGFSNHYEVTSNKEAGLGRYDVLLSPKDPKNKAIFIEFKTVTEESQMFSHDRPCHEERDARGRSATR